MQPTDQTSTGSCVKIHPFVEHNNCALTGFGVALERKHDLRSSVPSRCNIFSHVACVFFRVDTETSGQTEIANLKLAVGVNEQVTRLKITMQDVGAVDVLQATENLVDEGLEVGVGQRLARTNDGGKIALHELFRLDVSMISFVLGCTLILSLTLVQVCLIEVVRSRNVHVVQAGDVSVAAEVLQQLDLAQGTLGQNLLGEDICDLLESDALASVVVGGSADNAERALAELLGDSVALVDDEVLVEDLEDLAAGKRRVAHGGGVSKRFRRRRGVEGLGRMAGGRRANAAAERTKAGCNSGSGKRGEARARDWQWLPKRVDR